jgi:hypothetical protein
VPLLSSLLCQCIWGIIQVDPMLLCDVVVGQVACLQLLFLCA